jgi:hypothetical protein
MSTESKGQFLVEIYKESGEQVRNINTLRNTYLSFFSVGVAGFMGLLAGDGKPVASTIWYVIAVFSFVGVGLILITVGYIHRALNRQRLITKSS